MTDRRAVLLGLAAAWLVPTVYVSPAVGHTYLLPSFIIVILGGMAVGTVLDLDGIKALAELPSLDQLRGKIIGLLQAPATKIAGVLQAPAGQLARVLSAHASKAA